MNLKNKIAFITGASSGIGKACAETFAQAGCNLIICSRSYDKLNNVVEKIKQNSNVDILAFELDVRNSKSVFEKIYNLPNYWKNIDILINNAGLARGLNKFYEDEIDNWEEMIDTNIKGLLYVTKAVLPFMLEKNSGHIINIGSIAGREPYPKGAVYCATKHAVYAITKSLKMDLVDKNIRVSTIDPGMVETNFSVVRFGGDKIRAKEVYKGLEPLTAEDIADIALFIASRPERVNIAEAVVMPIAQASATISYRKTE